MAINRKWVCMLGAVTAAGYFALAFYLDRTYTDPRPKGQIVIDLVRPFSHEGGFAYGASQLKLADALKLAEISGDDPNVEQSTSPIEIFEDGINLGTGRGTFSEISKIGQGRFRYWRGQSIIFSSSDNTDPRSNGRNYWAIVR